MNDLKSGVIPLLLYCAAVFGKSEDAAKFEQIYEKYKALAYGISFGVLRDASLAEDAVSETFIRAYKNLDKIESADSPKTAGFIAVIAKNCAKTAAKKANLYNFGEITTEPADKFDLEQSVEDRITAAEIVDAADRLNDELRAVFLLKYAYDMSNKEIARTLGITAVNVGVLAHRAKKKLIEIITGKKSGKSRNQ